MGTSSIDSRLGALSRRQIVAVVGGGAETSRSVLGRAERTGELIASLGLILVTGGKAGVMEAASMGAARRGGLVIGLLPEANARTANIFVGVPIATGLGEARNAVVATCADAIVAIGGEYGTLSEIAHALKQSKPVLVFGKGWTDIPGICHVHNIGECRRALCHALGG